MNQALRKSAMFALLASISIDGVGTNAGSAQAPPEQSVAQHSGRYSGGSTRENRRLQERVESAYAAASEEFAYELVGANVSENPLHSARSEWQARIARCVNEGCRHSLLTEELSRLRFPFRTGRQNISHVPWQTGSFRIEYHGGGGGLQILPIIDDLILIRALTFESPNAAWICDLTAFGRVRADGTASMKVIGEDVRFTLATSRRGEIALRPAAPEPNGPAGCPGRGTLWGTYRPHYGR